MPTTYFLIDGLNGGEWANLLTKAIDFLNDTDIHLCSVTFDGASVNSKMSTKLGANFNIENGNPYIIYNDGQQLYIYYDPAHMLKLIRNAWEFKSVIINSKGEKICWKYIKMLYEIEQQEGLRSGTKLTKRNIEIYNEKMVWLFRPLVAV